MITAGINFRVNDDEGLTEQEYPAIATDGSGNFVITWEDDRLGIDVNYAQRFAQNGTKLGTNFQVHGDHDAEAPSIAIDVNGNFVIAWETVEGTIFKSHDIYFQRFQSNGTEIGTITHVAGGVSPSIASDANGNFVITFASGSNIYGQRFSNDGISADSLFKVNDEFIAVEQKHSYQEPSSYMLHQNYPNPFNPETTIGYELPASGTVVLKIYNVLGQNVRTLVNS